VPLQKCVAGAVAAGGREKPPERAAVADPAPQIPCGVRVLFWAKAVPRAAEAVRDPVEPAWPAPPHQCVLGLANAVEERPTDPWVFNRARDALGRAGVPKKLLEP